MPGRGMYAIFSQTSVGGGRAPTVNLLAEFSVQALCCSGKGRVGAAVVEGHIFVDGNSREACRLFWAACWCSASQDGSQPVLGNRAGLPARLRLAKEEALVPN